MADEPTGGRGDGGSPVGIFDDWETTPTKPLPILSSLRFSESGGLLHVTFTKDDGSQNDFQFNSAEIFSLATGNPSKVADMLEKDYNFPRALADKLVGEIRESPEFKILAAELQQQVQEPVQDARPGTQNAEPGTVNAEPSLGGTQTEAQLGAMLRPPGAAHWSGDSGISDPTRRVDLSAVRPGTGTDESSTFLVQPPDGKGGVPLRPVPPPAPSARRGKPDETVVIPDSGDAGAHGDTETQGDSEALTLEGDDILMESGPAGQVTKHVVTGGAAAAVEAQMAEAIEEGVAVHLPAEHGEGEEPAPAEDAGKPASASDVSRLNRQLLEAAGRDDVEVARAALANDADVNCTDEEFGRTPLMRATLNNAQRVFRLLLETPMVDINKKDVFGQTALDLARTWDNQVIIGIRSEFQRSGRAAFEKSETGSAALPVREATPGDLLGDERLVLSVAQPSGAPPSVSVPAMESPTMSIPAPKPEPLHPEGRPEGEDGVTMELPKAPAPPKVIIFSSGSVKITLEDGTSFKCSDGLAKRFAGYIARGNRDVVKRYLGLPSLGFSPEQAEQLVSAFEDSAIGKTLISEPAAPQPASAQAEPAPVQSQPASAQAQPQAPSPASRKPTPEELKALNAAYLTAAANGYVDGIKTAIAQGADKEVKNFEKNTALMLAVRYLHPAAVQCLVEEVKVDPHAKMECKFTVFDSLMYLGDSSEAQAIRNYLNGILEKEKEEAKKAKPFTQDSTMSALPKPVRARKGTKSNLSNLPWGWFIGGAVVLTASVSCMVSKSCRDFAIGLVEKAQTAAKVVFTDDIEATKDGGLRFTGFSLKGSWWKEGRYKLSETDAIPVADFMRLGLYDDAKKKLMQRFGVSDSMAEDMLEELGPLHSSSFLRKPFLRVDSGGETYRFLNIPINGVLTNCFISKEGMGAVVSAFVIDGRDAAITALEDAFVYTDASGKTVYHCPAWAGVKSIPGKVLGDMVDTVVLSTVGKPLVEGRRIALAELEKFEALEEAKQKAAQVPVAAGYPPLELPQQKQVQVTQPRPGFYEFTNVPCNDVAACNDGSLTSLTYPFDAESLSSFLFRFYRGEFTLKSAPKFSFLILVSAAEVSPLTSGIASDARETAEEVAAREAAKKKMEAEDAAAISAAQKESERRAAEEKAARKAAAEKERNERVAEKVAGERTAAQDERDRTKAAQERMKRTEGAKAKRVLGSCASQCNFGDTSLQRACLKQCRR